MWDDRDDPRHQTFSSGTLFIQSSQNVVDNERVGDRCLSPLHGPATTRASAPSRHVQRIANDGGRGTSRLLTVLYKRPSGSLTPRIQAQNWLKSTSPAAAVRSCHSTLPCRRSASAFRPPSVHRPGDTGTRFHPVVIAGFRFQGKRVPGKDPSVRSGDVSACSPLEFRGCVTCTVGLLG